MRWLGPAISVGVLIASAVWFFRHQDEFARIQALIPASPIFWLVFFVGYLAGPVTDWVMFRRLWNIPFEGFLALMRKQLSNALLPSYSGEVYFYAWARKHRELTQAPFGAIKDVAILSALTGNIMTIVMLAVAYPLFGELLGGIKIQPFALSLGFITFSSIVIMFFRGLLFSLPAKELWFISALVLLRVMVNTFVTAMLWHLIMPSVDLSWWLLLSTIKLLLTRLPFVPNQDVLFATVSTALLIHAHAGQIKLTDLVWMVTIVTTLVHIVFGIILGVSDLFQAGVDHEK